MAETEEKNSQHSPETEPKTTIVASDLESEIRKLTAEADAKAIELLGPYRALQVRITGELFPVLLKIRTLLPHGAWTPWYEDFCIRHNITTSLRTVQRAFDELTNDKLLSDGKPTNLTGIKDAAKALADAKAQLGKSAEDGNEQAKAIIAGYEKAVSDATIANPEKEKSSPETRVNKRLAFIVEVGEKYIRVMERVVYSDSVTLTERQKKDIEKTSQAWNKVLRDARELTWAVKTIERQREEGS